MSNSGAEVEMNFVPCIKPNSGSELHGPTRHSLTNVFYREVEAGMLGSHAMYGDVSGRGSGD